jgi:hypothetical protein
MSNVWQSWVSDQSVEEFLNEVDAAITEGTFPNRRAAFLEYATCVLMELASTRWGPPPADDGLSAGKLADLLLTHALAVEERTRRRELLSAN